MQLATIIFGLLCLSTLVCAAQLEFDAYYFSSPDCTGVHALLNYTNTQCYAYGPGSINLQIQNSSYVALLTWPVAGCAGNVTSVFYIANRICFRINDTKSIRVEWPLLVDVMTYNYANNSCAGDPAQTQRSVSNVCVSYAGFNRSTIFYNTNSSVGLICTWNQTGCPNTTGECQYVGNGDCNPLVSSAVKYAWTKPTNLTYYEYDAANCTGNLTASFVYYSNECAQNGRTSVRVDLLTSNWAVYYTWNSTQCLGEVSSAFNFSNNQCNAVGSGKSARLIWTTSSSSSTTSSTTSTSNTTSTTSTTSTTTTTTTTTTTGGGTPDLTYYVYLDSNCTGTPNITASYINRVCFSPAVNQSQTATIVDNSTASICLFSGNNCETQTGCFNLPNDKCYTSENDPRSYRLVFSSSLLPTPRPTSSSSSPSSSTTFSPTGSGLPTLSTTTGGASDAARACARSAALVLCAAVLSVLILA